MVADELDNVDKGILYLLQEDARTYTTTDIGEKVGVSSSTVGNRINKLQDMGVIQGYHPLIDYEKAGLGHHLLIGATVPFEDQEEIVDEIVSVPGVVNVRELLSNNDNLEIVLVARDTQDIEASVEKLNSHGVDIERIDMLKRERENPYNHFGKEYTYEDTTG